MLLEPRCALTTDNNVLATGREFANILSIETLLIQTPRGLWLSISLFEDARSCEIEQ